MGRHYQGITDGINSGMPQDPIEYSCQQNFALLTTDGYWNDSFTDIGNQDNANSGYTTRAWGAYDGGLASATNTLADVAAYYYKSDLRTTGAVAQNNVPTSVRDANPAQHMVTFTLGLGLEGLMDYQPDYESSATGDFAKIKAGTNNACSWTTGTCNWPVPSSNNPSTLDDLWHAAVNGRGKYFSAGDPNSLTLGLQGALAALNIQTAAAAASATSSPNITETDNFIYSSTFRTVKWDGEIVAQRIDTTLGQRVAGRRLVRFDAAERPHDRQQRHAQHLHDRRARRGQEEEFYLRRTFVRAVAGIAAERPYFDTKCTVLSQCALLTVAQKVIADSGDNLVNYLRGQRQHESFTLPETTRPSGPARTSWATR